MKKLLLVIMVTFFAIGSSLAQPGGGDPAARLQRELDGLTTELGLTKDQLAKVTPIVTEAQKKQSEAFAKMREAGGTMDRDKMREDRNKMQAETDKQLKAVLTPEQGVKLDAYRKKQAEERAKRMQQRGQ
jgi:Spy/CpxP family protein refolding chaperone